MIVLALLVIAFGLALYEFIKGTPVSGRSPMGLALLLALIALVAEPLLTTVSK